MVSKSVLFLQINSESRNSGKRKENEDAADEQPNSEYANENDAHPNPERRCYTVDELTQILGVGRKAVYSLIRKKAFPAIRISSIGYRIPKDSFNAWMLRQ